jgi:hypothetical protein
MSSGSGQSVGPFDNWHGRFNVFPLSKFVPTSKKIFILIVVHFVFYFFVVHN